MTIRSRAIILVVVAALAVAGIAAVPRYAKDRLSSTVTSLTAEVQTFALVNTIPDRSIYRMVVRVTNNGKVPVMYTARSLIVRFTPSHELGANGADQGTLGPGERVDIAREFTLFAPVVADFRAASPLPIKGNLNMEVSAKWLFWSIDAGAKPEITHTILFD